MEKQTKHSQLKAALMLKGSGVVKFAHNLKKPDGDVGVSHTIVIRVAQGHDEVSWIDEAIEREIAESKKNYPEYWEKQACKTT